MVINIITLSQETQRHTIILSTGDSGDEFHFSIHDIINDVPIFTGNSDYNDNWVYVMNFEIPNGQYLIQVSDEFGNGLTGGAFTIIDCNGFEVWSVIGNFGYYTEAEWNLEITDNCCITEIDSCPSDINNDGYISVSDLIIFIGDFGQTCNE